MSEDQISQLVSAVISVALGIAASGLFWLWLRHGLAPRIRWSENISAVNPEDGRPVRYRIKIQNVGWRAAVDFGATCVLRVPAIEGSVNHRLVLLRTLDVPIPRLSRRQGRVISVKTHGLAEEHVRDLPIKLRGMLNQEPAVPLDALLQAFEGAELVLYLSAYDEVSGTRVSSRSLPYTSSDISPRQFRANGVKLETRGPV